MARRRGFFAELQHQAKLAEKRRQQEARESAKAQAAAHRAAEQAQKRAATARAQAEKEASRLHREARQAEVAAMNADLAECYAEIDGILAATLDVDDWVDLHSLRQTLPPPPPPSRVPPEPVWSEPPAPSGLGAVLGGKRRHQEAVARARDEFERAQEQWRAEVARAQAWDAQVAQARQEQEREVAATNGRLDTLIAELGFDVPSAIQEYVGIVLGNSVYPEAFPVEHDYSFDIDLRELTLTAYVPAPADVPAVKEYKYVQARDEISSVALPQREAKERYRSAVAQVALRTLHEVFEADRAGRIHSIALTVATQAIDPGTGRPVEVPLVAVAADRETFTRLNLANVVPSATLAHLGAQVSKNPFDLVPIDLSKGVRGR